MCASDYLVILNILITFLGVLFVLFTLFEWRSLRTLRKSFLSLEKRLLASQHEAMKAAHRVISSYHIKDVDARISLLESVVKDCPGAFNAYNSLGYAYLEKIRLTGLLTPFRRPSSSIRTIPGNE